MSDTENTADTEEGDANVFDQEDVSNIYQTLNQFISKLKLAKSVY